MFLSQPGFLFNVAIILVYALASAHDIKTREVPNKYWLILSGLGIAGLFFNPVTPITLTVNVAFIAIVGYVLYVWDRTRIPGADFKAIIALGICYPYLLLIPLCTIFVSMVLASAFKIGDRFKSVPYVACITLGLILTLFIF
jgi:Flp pilus assembly protein protease CpaA